MANGLLATIAWGVVLVTYCVFRAYGIEDPILGQVFLLLTGLWVGNLTLAQGKKTARTDEKVDRLIEAVNASDRRADASEERESQWSKHKDHQSEDDG